jgi:hypothetical protein
MVERHACPPEFAKREPDVDGGVFDEEEAEPL